MKKSTNEKYATHKLFKGEMGVVHKRLDHLDHIGMKMANALLKVEVRLDRVDSALANTATKDDVRIILDTIDAFTKKVTVHERKALTHDHRLNEVEEKVADHERRLVDLKT